MKIVWGNYLGDLKALRVRWPDILNLLCNNKKMVSIKLKHFTGQVFILFLSVILGFVKFLKINIDLVTNDKDYNAN